MEIIPTADLFLPLQQELVKLLRGLSPDDWSRPTVAGSWRVKEVAAHLLDSDLRRLSTHRDRHQPSSTSSPESYGDLVAYLNHLNASWVAATDRLSPAVIVDLLEWAGAQVAEFFASLPAEGEALWPVAWAGEHRSLNWMDIGREYTEKWHHQAQIRDAVSAPQLAARRWLFPVIALSMYALPRAFRDTDASHGSVFAVAVSGDAGGDWWLIREKEQWRLREGKTETFAASASLDADTAWRLFFNGLAREDAEKRILLTGDTRLCDTFLSTRAVMV
jgi:Mycothiol maleylpyruvate isomerase N-terminal domain